MAEILVKGLRKTFDRGRVTAVGGDGGGDGGHGGDGVDLTVRDGEFFVLLGPSGCGKTTLLRMIAGLETADSGAIMIGDRDVTTLPPRRRDLAMVFQNYAIFPHLTVYQNIAFGLRMKGSDAAATRERVQWAAALVELGDLLERRPAQLSGGQRQRVAVARAIAVGPSVLLMDEPLSNLDALLRLKFRSDLKRIVHELNATTIYVTHDQVEALSLADRLAVMKDGQIIQSGPPLEVYDRPATTFVGGFIGTPPMNFLPVRITERDGQPEAVTGDGQAFPVPPQARPLAGRPLLAGIRGENVEAHEGEQAGSVRGKVLVVEPLGAQTLVTVRVGDAEVKVLTPASFSSAEGADLWLRPVPDKVRWYDPGSGAEVRQTEAVPTLCRRPCKCTGFCTATSAR